MLSFVDPSTLLPFPHISFGEHRCFAVEMGQPFAMMATTGLSQPAEFVLSIDGRNPLNNSPSSPDGAGVVSNNGGYICRGFQINSYEACPFIMGPRDITTGQRNGTGHLVGVAAVAVYGQARRELQFAAVPTSPHRHPTRSGGGATAGQHPVSAPLGEIEWQRANTPMYSWTAEYATRAEWLARGVNIPDLRVHSPWAIDASGFADRRKL